MKEQTTLRLAQKPSTRLYRDDVHEDILLDELAAAIIDTPEFQRLDGIKQLGFAYLVYRTAKHTRFEHSIGCYHVVQFLIDKVVENHRRHGEDNPFEALPEDYFGGDAATRVINLKKLLGVCALLHDIGHIPFGHTLEDEFSDLFEKHDSVKSDRLYNFLYHKDSRIGRVIVGRARPWIGSIPNEQLRDLIYVILCYKETVPLEGEYTGFRRWLETLQRANNDDEHLVGRVEDLRAKFQEFERQRIFEPYMADFISNTICADLLDYLDRDTRHVGFRPAFNSRLYQYFFIANDMNTDQRRHLTLRVFQRYRQSVKKDIVNAVFELMRTRHALTSQVYYHRVKAAASSMLVRALADSSVTEGSYYDGTVAVSRLSDEGLLAHLESTGGATAREMIELIRARRLYRAVAVVPYLSAVKSSGGITSFVSRLRADESERSRIELLVARQAGVAASHVMIYCPAPKMQAKNIDVRVQLDEDRARPLGRYPDEPIIQREINLLNDKYYDLWQVLVFLHPDSFERHEHVKAAVIEAFCSELHVQESSIVAPYGYTPPKEIRLREFGEWIDHEKNMLAKDADAMLETVRSGPKWRMFVKRAGKLGIGDVAFGALFTLLKKERYIEVFCKEALVADAESRRDARTYLRSNVMKIAAKSVGSSERGYYFEMFAEMIEGDKGRA
jgi:uncharacterized protein